MMRTYLIVSLGLAIAALSGWVHGTMTDRWGIPADVKAAADRVENLQLEIDGWSSEPGGKISDHTRTLAGAEGYFSQRYLHDESGASIHVSILCGRPGPISLHAPIYCFPLSGMTQLAEPSKSTITNTTSAEGAATVNHEFWMADFQPAPSDGGADIRTFWAWSPDGQHWSSPDTPSVDEGPRFAFAREPYLYRLYFTAPRALFESSLPAEGEEAATAEPKLSDVDLFMQEFLRRFAEVAGQTPSETAVQ